jgi:hypothetical protein
VALQKKFDEQRVTHTPMDGVQVNETANVLFTAGAALSNSMLSPAHTHTHKDAQYANAGCGDMRCRYLRKQEEAEYRCVCVCVYVCLGRYVM